MGFDFYKLNNTKYAGQCTEISVPLINKWMGILRTEDLSWECSSTIPDGYGLIEEYCPREKKDGIHVVIT